MSRNKTVFTFILSVVILLVTEEKAKHLHCWQVLFSTNAFHVGLAPISAYASSILY